MALLRLVLALLQMSGFRLTLARLPDGRDKLRILRAVDRAREHVPLRALLRFLRVSPSRFHAWSRRQRACVLDDQPCCPRMSPSRLTPSEVGAIKDLVTSPEYRHVPTGTLAVLAQRLGKVLGLALYLVPPGAAERLAPPPSPRAPGEATGGPSHDSS
jgi:hypothetical protein